MEPKSGYKTTEFWLSVFSAVVGFVVLSGIVPGLDQDTGDAVTAAVTQIVEAVVALVAIVGPIIGYTRSRTEVKMAAEQSVG